MIWHNSSAEDVIKELSADKTNVLASDFNTTLYNNVIADHRLLWDEDSHITSKSDSYYIVGEGKNTSEQYIFAFETDLSYATTSTCSGDDTVLCYSASMNDLYSDKTFFTGCTHMGLVTSDIVLDAVCGMIRGIFEPNKDIYEEQKPV